MAGIIIAGVVALSVILLWSMCAVAGDADEKMEELWRNKNEHDREKRM